MIARLFLVHQYNFTITIACVAYASDSSILSCLQSSSSDFPTKVTSTSSSYGSEISRVLASSTAPATSEMDTSLSSWVVDRMTSPSTKLNPSEADKSHPLSSTSTIHPSTREISSSDSILVCTHLVRVGRTFSQPPAGALLRVPELLKLHQAQAPTLRYLYPEPFSPHHAQGRRCLPRDYQQAATILWNWCIVI